MPFLPHRRSFKNAKVPHCGTNCTFAMLLVRGFCCGYLRQSYSEANRIIRPGYYEQEAKLRRREHANSHLFGKSLILSKSNRPSWADQCEGDLCRSCEGRTRGRKRDRTSVVRDIVLFAVVVCYRYYSYRRVLARRS